VHVVLGVEARPGLILTAAFDELAVMASRANPIEARQPALVDPTTQQCPPDGRSGRTRGLSRYNGISPR